MDIWAGKGRGVNRKGLGGWRGGQVGLGGTGQVLFQLINKEAQPPLKVQRKKGVATMRRAENTFYALYKSLSESDARALWQGWGMMALLNSWLRNPDS